MIVLKGWKWRELIALLICLLFAMLIFASQDANAGLFKPDIFGAKSAYATDLKMFPKWRGAMSRFAKELSGCPPETCNKASWQALIDGLKGADLKTKLKKVHVAMNKYPYIIDPINWNMPDYWATPFQFLRKSGDCEDYAIAKYMALKALGVPADIMRIVVLNDLNLNLAHAVLVVDLDGTPVVLDNQLKGVVAASTIRHYQPVYAVNEKGWWLYNTGS